MLTYVFFFVLATSVYFLFIKPLKRINRLVKQFQRNGYKVFKLPYNPLKIPFVTTMLEDSKNGDLYHSYKTKYVPYDILVSNRFMQPAIMLLSPEARKQFSKHEVDFTYKKLPLMVEHFSRVFGKGILFSEGNQWKRKRRILGKFFTYQFIASKIPKIFNICQKCFEEIQKQYQIKNPQSNESQFRFKLIQLTTRIFSEVILSIFLGVQSLKEQIQGQKASRFFVDFGSEYYRRTISFLPLLFGPKFMYIGVTKVDRDLKRRTSAVDKWAHIYVDKIIQKANSNKTKQAENLIELLYRQKNNNQQYYTRSELIDEFKMLFFAGTDTTAHFLQMMLYLTVKNKEVYTQAMKEVQNFQQNITNAESLKKLKYVQAVQKQTIRYYGPLPVILPRVCKPHIFSGVQIQGNTRIQFHSLSTHYNPKYYKDPTIFKPERWLNQKKQYDSAELVGFGMGPRSCMGQYLAHIQSKIAYCCFLKRYSKIQVPEKVRLVPQIMSAAQNLVVIVKK